MVNKERFDAVIGHDYDLIHDTLHDKYYGAITVADMINQLLEENRRLSKALRKAIAQKMNADKEVRRLKHEIYGG